MADFDDDNTGRLLVERLTQAPANPDAPVTQGQVQDIRAAVARFLVEHHTREATEKERARAAIEAEAARVKAEKHAEVISNRWRAAGGVAATIALTIASYAVALANQAAADHTRLDRVEASVTSISEEVRTGAASDRDRADDLMQRGMELQSLVLRVSTILDRIEPRIDALDNRLSDLEHDSRTSIRIPRRSP